MNFHRNSGSVHFNRLIFHKNGISLKFKDSIPVNFPDNKTEQRANVPGVSAEDTLFQPSNCGIEEVAAMVVQS